MRTRIKICGFTRAEDAFIAAKLGVDAVGLVFYERSARFVEVEKALEIIRILPPFVSIVGLFVDASPEKIQGILKKVPLDLLQFHGSEDAEFCQSFNKPYIKAVAMGGESDLAAIETEYQNSSGLLLDSHFSGAMGGTGEPFDWNKIPPSWAPKIILAGGLSPLNVGDAIKRVRPFAVDVSSGVERVKGIKDAVKMTAFVKEVNSV